MANVYFKIMAEEGFLLPGGSTADYYLNLIADETTACLNANGISFSSEDDAPENAAEIVLKTENLKSTQTPGMKIIFPSGDPESSRLAKIIFENMKKIYFNPSNIKIIPSNIPRGKGPSVTIVFENPQTEENLTWIRQNTEEVAAQIIMSLTEFFGVPYVACQEMQTGMAKEDESIRSRPNLISAVVGSTNKGEKVNVLGQWEDWYIIGENGNIGYIQTKFIEI